VHIGTTDENPRPCIQLFCAASFNDKPHQILLHIVETGLTQIMNNVISNRQITTVVTNASTYESLQLKGHAIDWRPATIFEEKIQSEMLLRLKPFEYLENLYRMKKTPLLTIPLAIHDIFDQTPGPEAGERIIKI
jgi:hypothetical protein